MEGGPLSYQDLAPSLRAYQWEGVHFLLGCESALLADEMGLGKTVQVSVALSLLYKKNIAAGRALIVVSASLSLNWEREIMRWAPRLSVRRVEGPEADRLYQYRLPYKVLIASYEQLRSDARKSVRSFASASWFSMRASESRTPIPVQPSPVALSVATDPGPLRASPSRTRSMISLASFVLSVPAFFNRV